MKQLVVFRGVQIFDAAQIVGEVSVDRETGYLTAPVNATKAGIFIYHDEVGREIRVLRPEEEVFKAESMATLPHKPATFNHPPTLKTADDIKPYICGSTGDQAGKVDIYLRTSVTVYTREAINAINAGNHEVSCGYTANVVKEAGVHYEFGPYDMIQRDIVYNHLAVGIPAGRGGPEVRMLLDSADPQPENTMAKIKVGDKEYEVPQEAADAWAKAEKDAKELKDAIAKAERDLKDAKKKDKKDDDDDDGDDEEAMDMADFVQAVTADSDSAVIATMDAIKPRTLGGRLIKGAFSKLQGRIVAATEAAKQTIQDAAITTPKKLAQAAATHAKLVAVCMAVMDKADPNELFAKESLELKKLVIAAKMPTVDLKGKSLEFVDGLYDGVAMGVAPSNVGEVLGKILSVTDADSAKGANEPRNPYQDAGFKMPAARKPWVKGPLEHSTRQPVAAKA